ncbi:AlpA family phage regulatory protein [Metallibacterium sp.]|uniref:helix-turn-helix transcriptional regulator n=1 Tax=Metallibacterium sp. TaxID=2940281 RepID=UPI00261E48D0|nr:AlpA family phage regulatory protein [Metallibacterium sp.]
MAQDIVRLLRLAVVLELTGLGRTTVFDYVRLGKFPAPVPLTATARAWRSDEIENWIAERIAARDAKTSSRPDVQNGAGGAA